MPSLSWNSPATIAKEDTSAAVPPIAWITRSTKQKTMKVVPSGSKSKNLSNNKEHWEIQTGACGERGAGVEQVIQDRAEHSTKHSGYYILAGDMGTYSISNMWYELCSVLVRSLGKPKYKWWVKMCTTLLVHTKMFNKFLIIQAPVVVWDCVNIVYVYVAWGGGG